MQGCMQGDALYISAALSNGAPCHLLQCTVLSTVHCALPCHLPCPAVHCLVPCHLLQCNVHWLYICSVRHHVVSLSSVLPQSAVTVRYPQLNCSPVTRGGHSGTQCKVHQVTVLYSLVTCNTDSAEYSGTQCKVQQVSAGGGGCSDQMGLVTHCVSLAVCFSAALDKVQR